MKKSIIKILLIIFSFFYSFSLSQTKGNYEFLYQLNKNLPEYGFNIEEINKGKDSTSYLIKIYQSDLDSLIQIIRLDLPDVPPYIDPLDVNFDGYKDLCFVTGLGQNGKNRSNDIFLFSPEDKKFHYSDDFSSILNIATNDSLKQIYGSYWTGCLDCITWNTYIIKNDKLILIKKDYQDLDRRTNILRRFVELYKDGKFISRKEMKPVDE